MFLLFFSSFSFFFWFLQSPKSFGWFHHYRCIVNLSWLKVIGAGGMHGQFTTHLVFVLAQVLMHTFHQITHKTDPGTFGLKEKDLYRKEYIDAVEEMCKLGSDTFAQAAGRRAHAHNKTLVLS